MSGDCTVLKEAEFFLKTDYVDNGLRRHYMKTRIITVALLVAVLFSFAACNHKAEEKKPTPTPAPAPAWTEIKTADNKTTLAITTFPKGMFKVTSTENMDVYTGNYEVNATITSVKFTDVKKNGVADSTFPTDVEIKSLKLTVVGLEFDLSKAGAESYEMGNLKDEPNSIAADTYKVKILEYTAASKTGKFVIYKADDDKKRSSATFEIKVNDAKIVISGKAQANDVDGVTGECENFDNQEEANSLDATAKTVTIKVDAKDYKFLIDDFDFE